MSSIRTRAAQRVLPTQIKESFNKNLITRDANLDSLFDECNQVEGFMKNLQSFTDHLRRSIDGIAAFSSGLNASLTELFSSSAHHSGPALQIAEVHQRMSGWAGECVGIRQTGVLDRLLEESQSWFVLFDEVKGMQKQRDKTRLIYDHYAAKLDELRTTVAKKKARNPSYTESSKEADRLQRVTSTQNEKKLFQATENFRADSQKCTVTVYQALESRYASVSPFVAKVVTLEIDLFRKAAGAVSSLKGVSEELLKANKDREREASEEQHRAQRKPESKGPPGQSLARRQEDVSKPQFRFEGSSEEEEQFPAQRQDRAATMGVWEGQAWTAPKQDPYAEYRTAAPDKVAEPPHRKDPYAEYRTAAPARAAEPPARPVPRAYEEYRQPASKPQQPAPRSPPTSDPWKQSDPWSQASDPRSKPQEAKRRPPEAPSYQDFDQWGPPAGKAEDPWGSDYASGVGLQPKAKANPYPPKGSSKPDYPDLL